MTSGRSVAPGDITSVVIAVEQLQFYPLCLPGFAGRPLTLGLMVVAVFNGIIIGTLVGIGRVIK